MKIDIITIGKLKSGPIKALCSDYQKRLRWDVSLEEIDNYGNLSPQEQKSRETNRLISKISFPCVPFFLDEKGKNLTSQEFADLLDHLALTNRKPTFVIGGSEGLDRKMCPQGAEFLSLGAMTWPHLLARLLLLEQLYRAQEILNGTKYHRI